jgi:hypothetical protein
MWRISRLEQEMAMARNNTPLPVNNPLQPTQSDFLMAAAIMHQQGKFGPGGEYQVAGDVVPFPDRGPPDAATRQRIQEFFRPKPPIKIEGPAGEPANIISGGPKLEVVPK